MILEDFHVHTSYTDGNDSLEDMVLAAIDLKMKRLGFSEHIYTSFDNSYCLTKEKTLEYIDEVKRLKSKYKGKISLYLGIEKDYFSDYPTDEFDYVIGSVHYIYKNDVYYSIDTSKDDLINIVKKNYNDNYNLFAKDYYNLISNVVNKTNADIIGHFDLVTKYNENNALFDMNNKEYLNIAKNAIDMLIPFNKPFEINTGAISRGYRTKAYPDIELLEYIYKRGGKVILSSDSHSKNTLLNKFNEYEDLVKNIGFKELVNWDNLKK